MPHTDNPPDGLCWDPLCSPFSGGPSPAVQDRDDLYDKNVDAFVALFIQRAYEMAAVHKGDLATMNIMWLMVSSPIGSAAQISHSMLDSHAHRLSCVAFVCYPQGSDFMYEGAETWFINLDRIIKAVNRNGTVHTRYSTPAEYVEAKLKEGVQRAVKTDDFFPVSSPAVRQPAAHRILLAISPLILASFFLCVAQYMSDPQNTWVGFYSTRPGLKGYVRSSSILLQTARQIETLSAGDGSGTARLWEALSLAQHHDGITGTELDWVADDYAMRIASGATEAYSFVDAAISRMTGATYQSCALLNISVCEVLRTASKPAYSVVFYNPQPRNVSTVVQIPIFGPSVPQSVVVTDSAGTEVVSDAYPLPVTSDLLNTSAIAAVSFAVNATGLSYSAYSVTPTFATPPRTRHAQHAGNLLVPAPPASDSVSIENEAVRLDFDVSTGLLASWTDKASGVQHALSQQFFYYESSNTSSAGCSNKYASLAPIACVLVLGLTARLASFSLVAAHQPTLRSPLLLRAQLPLPTAAGHRAESAVAGHSAAHSAERAHCADGVPALDGLAVTDRAAVLQPGRRRAGQRSGDRLDGGAGQHRRRAQQGGGDQVHDGHRQRRRALHGQQRARVPAAREGPAADVELDERQPCGGQLLPAVDRRMAGGRAVGAWRAGGPRGGSGVSAGRSAGGDAASARAVLVLWLQPQRDGRRWKGPSHLRHAPPCPLVRLLRL